MVATGSVAGAVICEIQLHWNQRQLSTKSKNLYAIHIEKPSKTGLKKDTQ